jgi:plasmid rolling circle replication initiator protein Rep
MSLYSPSAMQMLTEDVFEYKEKSNKIADLLKNSEAFEKKSKIIRSCGNYISYAVFEDGTFKLETANFCRERACPQCQRRRSLRVYANTCRVLNFLGDEFTYLHLVLTIPNVRYRELKKTISKLFIKSSEYFQNPELKKAFKGIMRCFEISYNSERKDFHPHLHCLIAVNKNYFTGRNYIRHKKLRLLWGETYGIKGLNIFIGRAYNGINAVAEIAKYAVKPFEVTEGQENKTKLLEKIFTALHGRRLIQTYGVIRQACRDLKLDIEETEENDNIELQKVIKLYWDGNCYAVFE